MATTPGTPTSNGAGGYNPDMLVSSFRTMLTHISELFTADNASSLVYINGLPSPADNAPHKPLDVLKELEKRGVFSHENVEPLIGLLTDLHRVDIINTCGVREYKEKAEHAKLTRGDSVSSMSAKLIGSTGGLNSRQQSQDLPSQNESVLPRSRGGSESKSDIRAGSGMGRGTPDVSCSQLPLLQQLSSGTASPRAQFSMSSSEECLHHTQTPSPPLTTHDQKKLGELSEEAKADLIAQLASDPQAVSLMREVVSKGEASGNGRGDDIVGAPGNKLQSLNINSKNSTVSMDEIRKQSLASATSQADEVLSPPIEFKSLDPSKTFYQRQTSTTSTQTDEELSLTQAGVIGSVASSRETGSTSGYDSIPTSFTVEGGHSHHSPGSLTHHDDHQSLVSSRTAQAAPEASQDNGNPAKTTTATPTKPSSPQKSSSKQAPDFDSSIEATKLLWKVKRLHLCELICRHSSKDFSKELKLSSVRKGTPRRTRRSGCDPVKLMFRLYPYGFGRDEGSFMSMRVCVRVDPNMYLRDMAIVHLKITTRLPPGEFVTIRTASNSLEDFVLNDFIPHDIIINQGSKNVEFLIEAYLTYDGLKVDMPHTEAEKLIGSITALGDGNDEEFMVLAGVVDKKTTSQ